MKLASTTLTVALLTILGTACPEPGGGGGTGGGNAGGGSAGGGAGGGGASSCDATSCPGGCCQGTTCLTGTQDASCGRQGVACQACAAPQLCVANACAVPPAIGDACASAAVCGPGRRCDESAPGGYCYQPCAGTTCPAASTCIGGGLSADGSPIPSLCLKTCAMEADCRTGFKCEALLGSSPVCTPKCKTDPDCESGVCEKATGRCITASVGTTCTRSTDCVGGLQCYSGAGIPGGYCSRNCGQTTCPGASRCVTLGDSESVCLLTCTVTADCRSGYECAAGACAPRCSSNAQCGFGKQCNTTTGRCVESGPAVRSIGAACTQASDCDSNICFDQASTGTPGGACTQSCQAATCPTGSVCAGTGVAAVCTFPCASNGNCRDGWVCSTFAGTPNVCIPTCTRVASVCNVATEVCLPNGVCTLTPTVSPMETNTSTTRAALSIPFVDDGASTPLVVTVPTDGISVQVVIDGPGSAELKVSRITGPSGVLYQLGTLGQAPLKLFNVSQSGAMSVLVPNAPDVPFGPGDYQFEFVSVRNEVVSAVPTINLKTSNTVVLGQANMDLTFVFVGSHPVITNAAVAQTNPEFQTMVNTFRSVFADGGVTVGNIEYLDAAPAVALQHADLANGALGDLVRTTAALPNERATVFWVQSIAGGGPGFTLLGVSAGIPGGLKKGSGVSGVVMSLGDFPNGFDNPTRMARTVTHEFGHWLGLFHATERGGTSFDPLADSPECPRDPFDVNSDGVMSPAECVSDGADNLMFWTQDLAVTARDRLTPQQKWVLLRNPAAR